MKVFVERSKFPFTAISVIVAVPYACNAGVIARNRVAPAPLTARFAFGTSVGFDELAVIEMVNNGELVSVSDTENTRFVASSSGIVTDDGNVITGVARAARPLSKRMNNVTTTPGRRVTFGASMPIKLFVVVVIADFLGSGVYSSGTDSFRADTTPLVELLPRLYRQKGRCL